MTLITLTVFFLSFVASHAKGEMLKHHSPLDSDHVRGRPAEHGVGRVSTPHDSKSYRIIDNPEAVLDSAECESFMGEIEYEMENLLMWTDDVIIDYICNPIEMAKFSQELSIVQEDASTQPDPCVKAYEQILLNNQEMLNNALADGQSCNDEIQAELAAIHSRRKLIGENGVSESTIHSMNMGVACAVSSIAAVAGVAASWCASDERLKTDIHLVGSSPSGIPIYTFKYREGMDLAGGSSLDTESVYFGAMAQDVLELVPDAVKKNPTDGYYRVDYSKIDVDFLKIAE